MIETQFCNEVPYVELHPTNNCIFECPWCTYLQFKERQRETLCLNDVRKVMELKPSSLIVCGGGDPTSYLVQNEGGAKLADLLALIRSHDPRPKVIVGTHGGFSETMANNLVPVLSKVFHVGVSLDASYEATRSGRDPGAFERALNNVTSIVVERTEREKETYVSSVFTRDNWVGLFLVARSLFDRLSESGKGPCKLKITFGPTSIADDSRTDDPYYQSRLEDAEKSGWMDRLRLISRQDDSFAEFLQERTKLSKAPKYRVPAFGVKHCGMVKNYVLAAADGYYYPCCVMAAKRSCRLGKISETSPEALSRKRQEFFETGTPPLCADGCRIKDHTLMGGKAWNS